MSFFGFIYKVFHRPIRGLWRVSSEGAENVPETGCILVCNHTSFSDVLVLEVASSRQVFFMGKAELFKIPVLKQLISALGAFPVNRGGADITSIKRTISEIQSGKVVGIFPQGTRHPYVDPRGTEVKGGVGMIAYRAKADVLPVFIDSAAGRTKIFRKNKVIFGKLIKFDEIPFEADGKKDYEGATRYVFAKACELKYGEGSGQLPIPEEGGAE
ncbi:MAG: 1-acyl-sn-glycerol-3-phosphate acyltransferase [Clostridia bacterium]|nr:1-acyl-sn-glycerol-3-phosphate acyltransferase [Clostridia bacterium]